MDNFLIIFGWIKLVELQLSIKVLTLHPLITEYWINFCKEDGAPAVMVARKGKCIDATVCWFCRFWGFDLQTLAKFPFFRKCCNQYLSQGIWFRHILNCHKKNIFEFQSSLIFLVDGGQFYQWRHFTCEFFWAISSARAWLNITCSSIDVFSREHCLIVFELSYDINELWVHSAQ